MDATVHWLEPLGSGKHGSVRCQAAADDVIAYMQQEYQLQFSDHPNYPYRSEVQALDDFLVIHAAHITYP